MNYRNLKGNKMWVTEALRPSLLKTPAEAEGSGSQHGPAVARVRHPAQGTERGCSQAHLLFSVGSQSFPFCQSQRPDLPPD